VFGRAQLADSSSPPWALCKGAAILILDRILGLNAQVAVVKGLEWDGTVTQPLTLPKRLWMMLVLREGLKTWGKGMIDFSCDETENR
jgi:hypothetical protein